MCVTATDIEQRFMCLMLLEDGKFKIMMLAPGEGLPASRQDGKYHVVRHSRCAGSVLFLIVYNHEYHTEGPYDFI